MEVKKIFLAVYNSIQFENSKNRVYKTADSTQHDVQSYIRQFYIPGPPVGPAGPTIPDKPEGPLLPRGPDGPLSPCGPRRPGGPAIKKKYICIYQ